MKNKMFSLSMSLFVVLTVLSVVSAVGGEEDVSDGWGEDIAWSANLQSALQQAATQWK